MVQCVSHRPTAVKGLRTITKVSGERVWVQIREGRLVSLESKS